ncbi:MAG: pseudouridine synthase [Luminiphilus sp.]|nr:pseudouridine synthase [Luminiphilus sp.]
MTTLILFNKPFQVLSQFSDRERVENPRKTLADFLSAPNYKVAGRLDYDSEGLLILTDDGQLQHEIAHPRHRHWKTYRVQVEGQIDTAACDKLAAGVALKDGETLPARCRLIESPDIWPRVPPIRYRMSVPDSWIELSISEGRNRQIRRMTAAVGFPTLRLIRTAVGPWSLDSLLPGEHRTIHTARKPKPSQPSKTSKQVVKRR